MMKKMLKYMTCLVIFLFLVSGASAMLPQVVFGRVVFSDVTYADQRIEIVSSRLGHKWEVYTNTNGVYTIQFNNFRDPLGRELNDGDTVDILACPVDVNPDCKKTVRVSTTPQEVNWGIDDSNADDLISDGAHDADDEDEEDYDPYLDVIIPDCPDLTCPAIPACPVCPGVPACVVCDACEEPEPEGNTLWAVIASLLIGAGAGGVGTYFTKKKEAMSKGVGIKIYTKRDGSEGVFHKHPGIQGYHDPQISHRDTKERHPKGELTPSYTKDINGDWVYDG